MISLVQDSYPRLKPSEKLLADLLLSDPEFILSASHEEIAARARVSDGTIARFCRAVGYRGLRDLRMAIKDAIENQGL